MSSASSDLELEQKLKINEIFFSIQGESSWVGYPTVFIRTTGCNLRCKYCDTTYAYYEGSMQSVGEILSAVRATGARYVCVTGGEPLLQPNVHVLLKQLCDAGFMVSIETGGSLDGSSIDRRVKKIIDVKTPDSGAADSFDPRNLPSSRVLRGADSATVSPVVNPEFEPAHKTEFKFVICSESDFEWAENFVRENQLFAETEVLYSPAFQRIDAKWLAEKILASKSPARLQTQLHKFIWSAHVRGV